VDVAGADDLVSSSDGFSSSSSTAGLLPAPAPLGEDRGPDTDAAHMVRVVRWPWMMHTE
jgi:hypothetical protein